MTKSMYREKQMRLESSQRDKSISPPPTKRQRYNVIETHKQAVQGDVQLSIYAWNVNGIQPFTQKPITDFFRAETPARVKRADSNLLEPAYLRDFLQRHSFPTCLLLQEVKINPSDILTQRAIQTAVSNSRNSTEPDYEAFFCLPSDKYNARGFGRKVYGVCSIIRRDFLREANATVRTVDWDLEGRFQVIETSAEGSCYPKLSIFNIYAVNGTDFAYKDSVTGQVAGTRHDRKLKVHKLLLEECHSLESQGYSVILAGDMNIARSPIDGHPNLRTFPEQHCRNRADFNKKFFEDIQGLQAIDTFRHLYPNGKRYTWFSRSVPFGHSCDRVDLIICSRRLLRGEALCDAGMLDSEAERATSDHCPLWTTFSFRSNESRTDDKV